LVLLNFFFLQHLPRICTKASFVRLGVAPERRFHILNTHLDHESRQARTKGAELIASRAPTSKAEPVIITGDLNATPDEECVRVLIHRTSGEHFIDVLATCDADKSSTLAAARTFTLL
jgi:endonuclease/exonuclease/phosphatase family metal-dependent hydrolase